MKCGSRFHPRVGALAREIEGGDGGFSLHVSFAICEVSQADCAGCEYSHPARVPTLWQNPAGPESSGCIVVTSPARRLNKFLHEHGAFMRFIALLWVVGILSGCQTIAVKDQDLIRPDSVTGWKSKGAFDGEKLKAVLPKATLSEEQIPVQQAGGDVTIKGVSVTLPEVKTTVLYFGGNLTHVDENGPFLSRLSAACPANFATFDYRGYGRSNGQPDVRVLSEDALRIYDHVRAKTKGKLLVYGYSLGGFMAGHIAANRAIDGLVLEATGTTVAELVDARVPWYAKPLVTVSISDTLKLVDNLSAVSQFKGKALVITGGNDRMMPAQLGKKLFDALPSQEKVYVLVPEGTHSRLTEDANVRRAYCELVGKLGS